MGYLVTGGGGFIGSHIVEHLARRGQRVRVLDDFSAGRRENLSGLPVEVLEGDIRDSEVVRAAVEGMDIVFHEAALCSVARSIDQPMVTHDINARSTVTLLNACRNAGVRRLVFASSSAVYGDAEVLPKRESMEPAPVSPYALTKWEGERYCRMFYELYGLETVCLRYFNVFGPRQDPGSEYAAVLPRFIEKALNGDRPTVYGTGGQTRDFTYVEDVVRANLRAADSEAAPGQVFNVASGEQRSLLEVIDSLARIVHRPLTPTFAQPRRGDIEHSHASIEMISRVLGHSPCVEFDQGLHRTVEWFRSSRHGRTRSVA